MCFTISSILTTFPPQRKISHKLCEAKHSISYLFPTQLKCHCMKCWKCFCWALLRSSMYIIICATDKEQKKEYMRFEGLGHYHLKSGRNEFQRLYSSITNKRCTHSRIWEWHVILMYCTINNVHWKYFTSSGATVSRAHQICNVWRMRRKSSSNKHEHQKTVETKQRRRRKRKKTTESKQFFYSFRVESQIVLSFWRQLPTNKKSSRRIYVHLPLICECMNDEQHIQDTT